MAIVNGTALESNKNFRVSFDGGNLSSDGGLLLLMEFYYKLGVNSLIQKFLYLLFGHKSHRLYDMNYATKTVKCTAFYPIFPLKHGLFLHFSYRLRLLDLQPFHQPAEGLRVELSQLLCVSRPLEPAIVQPLIQQYIAIAGIIQGFDPICSSSAEQEQTLLIQFCSILPHHDLRQTVYAAAYVRISARDIVILYPTQINHGVEAYLEKLQGLSGPHSPAA